MNDFYSSMTLLYRNLNSVKIEHDKRKNQYAKLTATKNILSENE